MRTEPSAGEQAKWTGCVRSEVEVVILKQAREPFTAKEAESARGGKAEERKRSRSGGGRRWEGVWVVIAVIAVILSSRNKPRELLRRQEPPSNRGAATRLEFFREMGPCIVV